MTSCGGYTGTITRTWTASDACGNTSSAVQVITVVDNTAPVLSSCPVDITVECETIPSPAIVTATDNCDPNPVIAFAEDKIMTGCGGYTGTITRTWTASDACGNISSSQQTIIVQDTTLPEIRISMDKDIYLTNESAILTVDMNDNCDEDPIITIALSNNGGESIPITEGALSLITLAGRNVISVTATDVCNNTKIEQISFEVILQLTGDQITIKPESLKVNPGEFVTFVVFPPPYDVITITDAFADGAPNQKINYDIDDNKAIVKFNRADITVLPIDKYFNVTGHFDYNGSSCQFMGWDDIKKVDEEESPSNKGNSPIQKANGKNR